MPSTGADDQAAGLRRLFGAPVAQVIAFVSARVSSGRTKVVVKTAAALAKGGQHVVLIDENTDQNNVHACFGMLPRLDLADLVQRADAAEKLAQQAGPRVSLIAAQRLANDLRHVDQEAAERLDSGLRKIQQGVSFVMIDCLTRTDGGLSPLSLAARHIAVVVAARTDAITDAYSLIKRLARERGREGFHIVVTRARNDIEAAAIYQNMRRTALDHLGVRLEYLGSSPEPETDHLAGGLQNRLPMADSSANGNGFSPFLAQPPLPRSVRWRTGLSLESVV